MRYGIVGFGVVGQATAREFPNVVALFDPEKEMREDVNSCDAVFVCVPTPMGNPLRILNQVIPEITVPIILRSTVPIGTTRMLQTFYQKDICFMPEFIGETPYHDPPKMLVVGGNEHVHAEIIEDWQSVHGPEPRVNVVTFEVAEAMKLGINAFLATKVAFFNAMYDIMGPDFLEVRELMLNDERITASHTAVFPNNRGFGGKCLPKDLLALGDHPLLQAVTGYNRSLRDASDYGTVEQSAPVDGAYER
jgi:UDPglucose 6-dehydrogenase